MIHRKRVNTRQTYNSIDSDVDSDDIPLALLKMYNALQTHHYTYKSTVSDNIRFAVMRKYHNSDDIP